MIPLPAESGVDDLQGYNVHCIVLQVPNRVARRER